LIKIKEKRVTMVGPYAVPEVIDIFTQYFDEQLKNVKSKFETVMKRSGLSFHWLEVKAAAPEVSEP
jgi:hypothetical protein